MLKKLNKYKIINLSLIAVFGSLAIGINYYLKQGYCVDLCSFETLNGFLKPMYFFSFWFSLILIFFQFLPTHIFRKWLFYVAPPVILLTLYLVQDISVYSNSLLNPTRAKMTENGMFVLAAVTVVFVAVHLFLDWKKKRNN